MRVTIRLFGRLHDLAGASELPRDVPAGATVRAVWDALASEFPAVAPHGRSVSAAVNADFAKMTTPLAEGDEVAFLPPVSGGCGAAPGATDAGPGTER
jgi:molybdopterin converting factor subunit 1